MVSSHEEKELCWICHNEIIQYYHDGYKGLRGKCSTCKIDFPLEWLWSKSPRIQFPVWELKWAHGDSPTKLGIKVDADRCEIIFEVLTSLSNFVYNVNKPNKSNKFFLLLKNLEKRVCVIIDGDVGKKLRLLQAKLIRKNHASCSYSDVINYSLRIHFFWKNEWFY